MKINDSNLNKNIKSALKLNPEDENLISGSFKLNFYLYIINFKTITNIIIFRIKLIN